MSVKMAVAVVLLFATFTLNAELLPVEAFSQLPQAYSVNISPDGKSLAYLANSDNDTLIVAMDIASLTAQPLVKTDNEKYKVTWLKWANNHQIVFGAKYPGHRGTTGTSETRLMVVDKDSISGPKLISKPIKHVAQFQDNVIDWLPDDPDHILVSADFDYPVHGSVFKVDLRGPIIRRYKRYRQPVRDWQTDQQGRVRIGNAYRAKSGVSFTRILDIENDEWHDMWERKALLDPIYFPLGFGLDPHTLYLRADHEGRGAVFTVDTRHLDRDPVLKVSDANYDIQGKLVYSEKTREVIGVKHSRSDLGVIYWDESYEALENGLDKVLPDTYNEIINFSRDEKRYVVSVSSAMVPAMYFVGDRARKTISPILLSYPQLSEKILAKKEQRKIEMRDGLIIEAYLTLPNNRKPNELVPAIIFPHGGPISRSHGNFDYWSQFFANRGIAVLEPNFRGSSGFGHAFKLEAIANYGKGMQDDLVDSTKWLIDEGIVDPKRICIVGASYGGYAALTATFKTPDLFRCAVSFAGISNLKDLRNHSRKFVNKVVARSQLGSDLDDLERNSAYYNVDRIKVPVLLAHGDKDRVVLPSQSKDMADRLKKAKKEYEYLELKNGTHYLNNQRNRTLFFKTMDDFLAKYLL